MKTKIKAKRTAKTAVKQNWFAGILSQISAIFK